MSSATRPLLAFVLVVVAGCGGGNDDQAQQAESLEQRLRVVESRVERLTEGIESCRASVRQIDEKLADANFHVECVPQLVRDVDAVKANLAQASEILRGVSRKDDLLVLRGMMVADEAGNPRCLVSPKGLSMWDASGRNVCQMEYDEAARAMSASLRGYGTKSVALYAGEDRVAIGAYDTRKNGVVGWAATVTPEGEVTAGRAGR